jgi:TRAP-type mannitol/chloroaromatic compound transport system substrate-binding protein
MMGGSVCPGFAMLSLGLLASVSGCALDGDADSVAIEKAPYGRLLAPLSTVRDPTRSSLAVGAGTTIDIAMRSFSANPSVGGSATSVGDVTRPNYGALAIFTETAAAYTHHRVTFSITSWAPTAPNTVIEQVGVDGDSQDAAYDTGGALNPTWGLFYLSMAPFHLSYRQTLDWLYDEGGLALAQSLIDARNLNVKIIPVLSSTPQIAGDFKAPIGSVSGEGEPAREAGIGMAGLCTSGWTLRFLPPGEVIIDRACDAMVADGSIPAKHLSFVTAIPGLSNLAAIQSGAVTGFEQATPMDDLSLFYPDPGAAPVPQSSQNPGHKGLRFLHFPSWHQPFLLGFVLLNETTIWNNLSRSDQRALERAGRDALAESFEASESAQCEKLRALLAFNDEQVQLDAVGDPILDADGQAISADLRIARYGRAALRRLQDSTGAYLESLRGGANPTEDQLEYRQIYDSILAYERKIHFRWRPTQFPRECDLSDEPPGE